MTLQTLSRVHAAHDIHRGEHTVVTHGCPGRIVDSHRSWADTTYTVEFAPRSKKHRRAGITLVGLTEGDVHPDADRPADDAGSRKIRRRMAHEQPWCWDRGGQRRCANLTAAGRSCRLDE